jgi:hypothetical protein
MLNPCLPLFWMRLLTSVSLREPSRRAMPDPLLPEISLERKVLPPSLCCTEIPSSWLSLMEFSWKVLLLGARPESPAASFTPMPLVRREFFRKTLPLTSPSSRTPSAPARALLAMVFPWMVLRLAERSPSVIAIPPALLWESSFSRTSVLSEPRRVMP